MADAPDFVSTTSVNLLLITGFPFSYMRIKLFCSSSVYLCRVKIKRQNLICGCGGIGRRARLCFHHLGEFIVDYGFPVFIYED